jgi:hypothetical protein
MIFVLSLTEQIADNRVKSLEITASHPGFAAGPDAYLPHHLDADGANLT